MAEVVAAVVAIVAYVTAAYAAYGAIINLVIAIGATLYSSSQAKKQEAAAKKAAKRAAMEAQQRNAFRNFRQPLSARRLVIGRTRVAGPFIFAHNPNDGTEAHLIVALAAHEIDGIEAFFILSDQVAVILTPGANYGRTTGKYARNVKIYPYMGTASQNIGTRMATTLDIIEETDRFAGIAALYIVTFKFGIELEGAQPDFAARVRGLKAYNPISNVTAWTENPALIAYHYLVTPKHQGGMGYNPANIDLPSLAKAIAVCNQIVPLADGTTQKRYIIGGVIDADTEHREALDLIADCMAGHIRYSSGMWFIEAGAPKEMADINFHEEMVLGPYDIDMDRPSQAFPNAVRGNFFDAETSQPMSFPQWTLPEAAEQEITWLDIELPLVTNHVQAQRIARIRLGEARARSSLSIEVDLRGMLVRPGDVIPYTSPDLGIDHQLFLVDAWTLSRQDLGKGPVLTTRLDLVDYDPSIFDWNAATDEQELDRGTVNLVAIPGLNLVGLTYAEESAGYNSFRWEANYVFVWPEAITAPEQGTPLQVRATVSVSVTAKNLASKRKTMISTRSVTGEYTGGTGTLTLHFIGDNFDFGYANMLSRIVKDAYVQVIFEDGSFSPAIPATFVP
jgi:hypothetical protein